MIFALDNTGFSYSYAGFLHNFTSNFKAAHAAFEVNIECKLM